MTRLTHPQLRAFQRYGLCVGKTELIEMAATLGPENLVQAQEGGGVHLIHWEGVRVLVAALYVGRKGFPVIRTFLPIEDLSKSPDRPRAPPGDKPRRRHRKPQPGRRPEQQRQRYDEAY